MLWLSSTVCVCATGATCWCRTPTRATPSSLILSLSDDGVVFDRMGYLVGGRWVDYPHVIEEDGHLFVAFAGGKQTVEVLKILIDDLDSIG